MTDLQRKEIKGISQRLQSELVKLSEIRNNIDAELDQSEDEEPNEETDFYIVAIDDSMSYLESCLNQLEEIYKEEEH